MHWQWRMPSADVPDYSRVMNPTVTFFENKVKALTGAADVIAFSSGMAAISNTLMAVAAAGKNIVTSHHLFGNTYALITKTLQRFGVTPKLYDLTRPQEVEAAVDDHSCAIYLGKTCWTTSDKRQKEEMPMIDFTEEELYRYSRHILLPDIGAEGQERIRQGRVLVVGAGGLGAVVGTIGTIQATEVLKYLTGTGQLLTDCLLTFNAQSMDFQKLTTSRNCDCPVCGDRPTLTELTGREPPACHLSRHRRP